MLLIRARVTLAIKTAWILTVAPFAVAVTLPTTNGFKPTNYWHLNEAFTVKIVFMSLTPLDEAMVKT